MGRLAIIVTVGAWLAYVVMWFSEDFLAESAAGSAVGSSDTS
jgi:hypothetical protein